MSGVAETRKVTNGGQQALGLPLPLQFLDISHARNFENFAILFAMTLVVRISSLCDIDYQ